MTTVLHLLGATCAGKSTLQDRLAHRFPKDVHCVQVGRMMRAKYPPEYFKGQAAPTHTQDEAWQMYRDSVEQGYRQEKKLIVVDGQPRDQIQVERIVHTQRWVAKPGMGPFDTAFLLIHARHEKREERARLGRTPGPDLDLALARLTNDYRNCYTVLTYLLEHKISVPVLNTTDWNLGDVEKAVHDLGQQYNLKS